METDRQTERAQTHTHPPSHTLDDRRLAGGRLRLGEGEEGQGEVDEGRAVRLHGLLQHQLSQGEEGGDGDFGCE